MSAHAHGGSTPSLSAPQRYPWDSGQFAFIVEHAGLGAEALTAALIERYGIPRTLGAVKRQMSLLKVLPPRILPLGEPWTAEHDQFLTRHLSENISETSRLLTRVFGIPRSRASIQARIVKLEQMNRTTIRRKRRRNGQVSANPRARLAPHVTWTEQEEAELRRYANQMTLDEFRQHLLRVLGSERSTKAIGQRLFKLGLGQMIPSHNMTTLARAMGCSVVRVTGWIDRGWLAAERLVEGDRRCKHLVIRDAAIDRFLNQYPRAYDWRLIRDRRWHSVAEVIFKRNPYYRVSEAAKILGMKPGTVCWYINEGYLPAERAPVRLRASTAGSPEYLITERDLTEFARLRAHGVRAVTGRTTYGRSTLVTIQGQRLQESLRKAARIGKSAPLLTDASVRT